MRTPLATAPTATTAAVATTTRQRAMGCFAFGSSAFSFTFAPPSRALLALRFALRLEFIVHLLNLASCLLEVRVHLERAAFDLFLRASAGRQDHLLPDLSGPCLARLQLVAGQHVGDFLERRRAVLRDDLVLLRDMRFGYGISCVWVLHSMRSSTLRVRVGAYYDPSARTDSGSKTRPRTAGSELRIPTRYSASRWFCYPWGWRVCSVSSPRACPIAFRVSGRTDCRLSMVSTCSWTTSIDAMRSMAKLGVSPSAYKCLY